MKSSNTNYCVFIFHNFLVEHNLCPVRCIPWKSALVCILGDNIFVGSNVGLVHRYFWFGLARKL